MQGFGKVAGIVACIIGIVALVFGILFMVMGAATANEVMDTVEAENFPEISYDENSPATGYLELHMGTKIDTVEEIEAAADAMTAARHKMYDPSSQANVAAAMGDQAWNNYLSFEGVLGLMLSGLGLAGLLAFMGILNIIIGIALILIGIIIYKLIGSIAGMSAAIAGKT